jgi:hypothetical protein
MSDLAIYSASEFPHYQHWAALSSWTITNCQALLASAAYSSCVVYLHLLFEKVRVAGVDGCFSSREHIKHRVVARGRTRSLAD